MSNPVDRRFDDSPDLDAKIERLFGLIHEELRTLRDLVTAKVTDLRQQVADHEVRIAALEAASKGTP